MSRNVFGFFSFVVFMVLGGLLIEWLFSGDRGIVQIVLTAVIASALYFGIAWLWARRKGSNNA